jgi:hypothetical protein
MKQLSLLSILFILLVAACQPDSAEVPPLPTRDTGGEVVVPTPIVAEPTAIPAGATATPVEATAVPAEPTAIPVQPTAVLPTQAPVSNPQFSDLKLLPNRASLSAGWPQPYTPITTRELYAVWNYSGMTAADEVERLWYYNGTLWLQRQEMWDVGKYGANGRVEDIFVYDYEPHLAPGHYRVVLKVDGVEMISAEHTIATNTVSPKIEPNTGFTAAVQDSRRLVLRRVDGTTASWISSGDIVSFDWFPSGQAVVYSEQVVVDPNLPGTLGLRHNLWIQDVLSGEKWLLANTGEDLHTPVVSPDGRRLALLSGTLYGDACGFDAGLHVMELTEGFVRDTLINLDDFTNLPVVEFATPHPAFINKKGEYTSTPGLWQDVDTLEAGITWICGETDAHGIYYLHVTDLTAEKVAELPLP